MTFIGGLHVQLSIEIYTRQNEVCHATTGSKALQVNSELWHELIDSDLAGISADLADQ